MSSGRPGLILIFGACLTLGFVSCLPPSSSAQVPPGRQHYEFHNPHDPDGTGKFYQGREIALVMGHEGASWLERPDREQEEHSEQLVDLLALKQGDVAADIGAGTGYFSRRLAVSVGPTGKVFAEDIQPEMLALMTNQLAKAHVTNVTAVLGTITDPKLPTASVDLALLVDVYHELEFPFEMMESICRALRPNGRIVFVEFRGEDPNVPIKPLHKMTEAQVKKEMSLLPLEWVETKKDLPWQHVIIFRRKSQP